MYNVGITDSAVAEFSSTQSDNATMGKQDFLTLLTMQLQYQDPLNPMKDSDFAAQLAQYSQLESLNNINENIESQLVLDQSLNNSFMTSMLGKDVEAYGNGLDFDGGETDIEYYLSRDANVIIKIYDENGNLVNEINASARSGGDQKYTWDGHNALGTNLEPGYYTYEIEATDSEGIEVTSYGYTSGNISGISYDQGSPYLLVNGQYINLGDIVSILTPNP